ncbi:MAG: PQQ-binding-like beta-propeller repeat protein, partial [Planctomycetota bacterium]|nr:PQQ-binding-like beta-propeller repeat protein [Planctomycetota bacterium]
FYFHCDSVIMEAARRVDEWGYIRERIPTTSEVFFAVHDQISDSQFGDDAPAIYERLDGRCSVERAAALTGLTLFQVCKPLSQMLDAGVVAPVAAADLVPLAEECLEDGRLEDAVALCERAIESTVGLPEAHALAAEACCAAARYEDAVSHLVAEADHRVAVGDLVSAAQCLDEARRILPTDLTVREGLLSLCVGDAAVQVDGLDPIAEGKEVVAGLVEVGHLDRARALLERLLLAGPGDAELKVALVNLHVRAGDHARVVELYESIAEDLVRARRPLEAVAYLQKILLLDRHRTDISQRVRRLYEFDERARQRKRVLHALAGLFVFLVALGGSYWFYNARAEEDFAAIDVTGLVAADDFASARARYDRFVADHPLTTAVAKADAELQKIESAQGLFDARRASEDAARAARLEGLRRRYAELWQRQGQEFLAGRPEEALASIERVRELVVEAGAPEDIQWAHEQSVQQAWRDLREHVDAAQALGARYDAHLAAGDFTAARRLALQLHDEFGMTEQGRGARVPVVVTTWPAGAALFGAEGPLRQFAGERGELLVTPGVVLCDVGVPTRLTARLDGFEDLALSVDARAAGELGAVMTVVPERVLEFGARAQTGAGVGGGWLAVGLRGGRLGVARTDGSDCRVVELGGLKAAVSTPVVAGGVAYFLTNEATIERAMCAPNAGDAAWSIALPDEAVTPLVSGGGRLLIVDRSDTLRCWEQASGRALWHVELGAAISGRPTVSQRQVYVGLADGRLLVHDLVDGSAVRVIRSPAGLATRVHVNRGELVFGCVDGAVRAVGAEGGELRWKRAVDGGLGDEGLAVNADEVCVVTSAGAELWRRKDGALIKRVTSGDAVMHVQAAGRQWLLQVRRPSASGDSVRDVLLAVAGGDAEPMWEFPAGGRIPGPCGVNALRVALPTEDGRVVMFR